MKTLSIAVTTHGRVLLREVASPAGLLIAFHGYMENAEIQMERLLSIPGAAAWTLASVQGLHRFYRGRTQDVVASWMTRQDRDAAIADNIAYVDRVVADVRTGREPLVFAGFSQGVAMAFRGAVRGAAAAAAVFAVGGDVPPELVADRALAFPRVLLARGAEDEWYTDATLQADVAPLRARGAAVEAVTYRGGHEWTSEVSQIAGGFLGSIR